MPPKIKRVPIYGGELPGMTVGETVCWRSSSVGLLNWVYTGTSVHPNTCMQWSLC